MQEYAKAMENKVPIVTVVKG